jgi:DNA-binding NarL/FixJ family response regulator
MKKVEHRELLEHLRPARRVLIVDDHPSFRGCARALLTAEGFEVVGEAADGRTGLELAGRLQPELVLLDIQLPDIDGRDVAVQMLRRDPELAIVLVSSRDQADYGALIEKTGARGFISKADLSGVVLEELLE